MYTMVLEKNPSESKLLPTQDFCKYEFRYVRETSFLRIIGSSITWSICFGIQGLILTISDV